MKIILALLVSFITLETIFASQVNVEISGKPPEVYLTSNSEIEIAYSQDRVARLTFFENNIKNNKIKISKFSSSCEKKLIPVECEMDVWTGLYFFNATWIKHPDKKKINSVVSNKDGGSNTPMDVVDWSMRFWSNVEEKNKLFADQIQKSIPTTISCPSWSWMNFKSKTIIDVSFEMFSLSNETELNENKIVRSFKDVTFDIDHSKIIFKSMKPLYLSNMSNNVVLQAPAYFDFINFIVELPDSKVCKLNFERKTVKTFLPMNTIALPLKFATLDKAAKQLRQQMSDATKDYSLLYQAEFEKLPAGIQILTVFGLAQVQFIKDYKNQLHLNITIGEAQ